MKILISTDVTGTSNTTDLLLVFIIDGSVTFSERL